MIINEPILSITDSDHFELYLSLINLMKVKKDKNGKIWLCIALPEKFNVNKMNTYGIISL